MTTTAPAPVSVEYPFPYETGAYVARIAGPHGRYGLDREWLEPTGGNKSKGRAVYTLTPGLYVTRTRRQSTGKPNPEEVIAVTLTGMVEEMGQTPDDRDQVRQLGKAGKRGDTPDTPGAWRGRLCWCGDEATHHQPATGRARCQEHYKPPTIEEEPPPRIYDPEPDYDYREEATR